MNQNVSFLTPEAAEQQAIQRRQKFADVLGGEAMQPIQSQTAPGGWVVKNHPIQGLEKLAKAFVSAQMMKKGDADAAALAQRTQERTGADTALLARALQGSPAQPAGMLDDGSGGYSPGTPAQTPVQALGQAIPLMGSQMQPHALQALEGAQTRQQQQQFQAAQAEENRKAREHQMLLAQTATRERAEADRLSRETMAREGLQTRQAIATGNQQQRPPVAVIGPDGKPMYVRPDDAIGKQPYSQKQGGGQLPPGALKEQNQLLEEIGIASGITSDLGRLHGQLSTGEFSVGPIANKLNAARNAVGMSNDESQKYNTFSTTLERLRNDSLRLNKGVQTEGDAQRAWNELMGSLNDPAVVKKRLLEIQAINQRAVGLKKLQIDTLRHNFGMEGMDTKAFTNLPPAVSPPENEPTDFATLSRGRRATDRR